MFEKSKEATEAPAPTDDGQTLPPEITQVHPGNNVCQEALTKPQSGVVAARTLLQGSAELDMGDAESAEHTVAAPEPAETAPALQNDDLPETPEAPPASDSQAFTSETPLSPPPPLTNEAAPELPFQSSSVHEPTGPSETLPHASPQAPELATDRAASSEAVADYAPPRQPALPAETRDTPEDGVLLLPPNMPPEDNGSKQEEGTSQPLPGDTAPLPHAEQSEAVVESDHEPPSTLTGSATPLSPVDEIGAVDKSDTRASSEQERLLEEVREPDTLENYAQPHALQPVQDSGDVESMVQREPNALPAEQDAESSAIVATETEALSEVPAKPEDLRTPTERLVESFESFVADVDLSKVAVPMSEKPIRDLDGFSLVPLTGRNREDTLDDPGFLVEDQVPEGLRTTYQEVDGDATPYLDAQHAVGLVYKQNLIAVASAGIDPKNRLLIVQVQDVTDVHKSDGKAYYQTGLHNGMLWRATMVGVWEEIGASLGTDGVAIQSNRNSLWTQMREAEVKVHDKLANDVGYKWEPSTGNWVKPQPD